jgi:hypothetical protein
MNHTRQLHRLLVAVTAIFLTGTLHAQAPPLINYQGRVAVDGVNFDGPGQFRFALVNADASESFWSNDGTSVAGSEPAAAVPLPVSKGLYSVLLGDIALANMTAIPTTAFSNADVRLRVWFDDGVNAVQLLTPDQRLAPAAYLADGAVTSSTIADGAIVAAKIAPAAINGAHLAAGSLDFSHLTVPAAPGAGQVLGFDGNGLSWTSGGGGGGAGPSPWILSGSEPYMSWHDTASGRSATLSSANGSIYYRVPDAANTVVTAGYVDSNGMVTRGRLAVEGFGPYITWSDFTSGRQATISSANGALYYRVPDAANVVTTAGYVDSNGMVTRGRMVVEGSGPYITWSDSTTGKQASISSASGALYYRVPNAANNIVTAGYVDSNGLVVNGRISVTGSVDVRSLTIRGGADLAEPFAMSQSGVEPGSVVVIDRENPGKLRRSTRAYDKKVAGIVSGANGIRPGISMIQEDKLEAGENVALSGRVYVQADTSAGPIEPGDLLTTSSTAGRAMKAADHDKAQGAIIGKAMTRLDEGDGMVLVLVTLQ